MLEHSLDKYDDIRFWHPPYLNIIAIASVRGSTKESESFEAITSKQDAMDILNHLLKHNQTQADYFNGMRSILINQY